MKLIGRTSIALLSFLVFFPSGSEGNSSQSVLKEITQGLEASASDTLSVSIEPGGDFLDLPQYPYPHDGVEIGQGWNSYTERGTTGRCVNVREIPIEASAFESYTSVIKSTYSLMKSQSLQAKLSGSYGGFSGGGSFSSSRKYSLDTKDLNVLFDFSSNIAGTRAVGEPSGSNDGSARLERLILDERFAKLSPEAQKLLVETYASRDDSRVEYRITLTSKALELLEKKNDEFEKVCGNGFVSAINRGTKIQVVASFTSRKETDRKTFEASAKAGGFGVSASAKTTSAATKKILDENTQFRIYQEGGVPIGPPKDFEAVRSILQDPSNFITNPVGYDVLVTPYSDITKNTNIPAHRTPDQLNRLGAYYVVLSDLYEEVQGIVNERLIISESADSDNYSGAVITAYGGEAHLIKLKDKIQSDLDFLKYSIESCLDKKSTCTEGGTKAKMYGFIDQLENNKVKLEEFQLELQKSSFKIDSYISKRSKDFSEILDLLEVVDVSSKFTSTNLVSKNDLISLSGDRITKIDKDIDTLNEITGVLGSENSAIDDEFFLRFYNYLLETPPPLTTLSAKITLDANDASLMNRIQRNNLYLHALSPWRDYFCKNVLSDSLCVNDTYLFNLIDNAELKEASAAYRLVFKIRYCKAYKYKVKFSRGKFRLKKNGCKKWGWKDAPVTSTSDVVNP